MVMTMASTPSLKASSRPVFIAPRALADQDDGRRPGTVRADDQRLLDVGGLRRAGDEEAEAGRAEAQPPVGLVERVDQLACPGTTRTRCWVTKSTARRSRSTASVSQTAPFSATPNSPGTTARSTPASPCGSATASRTRLPGSTSGTSETICLAACATGSARTAAAASASPATRTQAPPTSVTLWAKRAGEVLEPHRRGGHVGQRRRRRPRLPQALEHLLAASSHGGSSTPRGSSAPGAAGGRARAPSRRTSLRSSPAGSSRPKKRTIHPGQAVEPGPLEHPAGDRDPAALAGRGEARGRRARAARRAAGCGGRSSPGRRRCTSRTGWRRTGSVDVARRRRAAGESTEPMGPGTVVP